MQNKEEIRYCELTYGSEYISSYVNENNVVYIKNYKLKDIFSNGAMSMSKYFWLCGIVNYRELDTSKLNEDEYIAFESERIISYATFLNEMVKCDKVQVVEHDTFRLFVDDQVIDLNKKEIDVIFDDFQEIYCLKNKDAHDKFSSAKPQTEHGKEIIEILRKAQQKIDAKKNGMYTIDSIIMGIATKHSSYNLFNIFELTMWQLMVTHKIMNNIDFANQYNMTMAMGNIDTSKSKINQNDLSWSSRKY